MSTQIKPSHSIDDNQKIENGKIHQAVQILVVDDEPAICDAISKYMELFDYQMFIAYSAESAIETISQNKIQLIITDIMLPGMDGLQLTELVKQRYDVDVIAMTGYSGNYSYEDAIIKGASDFVFKPFRFEELLLRVKRVLKERELRRERSNMLQKLEEMAITDGLTKLYNSRQFYHQIELETERSMRYNQPLSLLLMDVDYFKNYNDKYGHLNGDIVLARIGQNIQSCLRKPDSAYRYGGEEFTILLPQTSGDEAINVARRISGSVEEEKFYPEEGESVTVTISTGVAEYFPKEKIKLFIKRADKAMYLSKQSGRNRITVLYPDK